MRKKSRVSHFWRNTVQMSMDLAEDHIAAYAAMASFFIMFSIIPILILLLALVQYLPPSQADVMDLLGHVFPESFSSLIEMIVNEVFRSSVWTIPLSLLSALWGAGRGMMAISKGLNCVHDTIETRNYFVIRILGALYTILLILTVALTLVLQVFGVELADFLVSKFPVIQPVIMDIMRLRSIFIFLLVWLIAWAVYCLLPNKKVRKKHQIPGAFVTSIGWVLCSWIYSKFTQIFKGFSNMYGSLTMIILFMMWLDMCMWILMVGAEVNLWLDEYEVYDRIPLIRRGHKEREARFIEKTRKHNMDLMRKQLAKNVRTEPMLYGKIQDAEDRVQEDMDHE